MNPSGFYCTLYIHDKGDLVRQYKLKMWIVLKEAITQYQYIWYILDIFIHGNIFVSNTFAAQALTPL